MATARSVTITGLNSDITDEMVKSAFIKKYKFAQVEFISFARVGTTGKGNYSMGVKEQIYIF